MAFLRRGATLASRLQRGFATATATPAPSNRFVKIVEVSPRDGLQNETKSVDVQTKVELINRLQQAGATCIEAGSFVSPKWVPQMADTDKVLVQMPRKSDISYPVLVPNAKGLENLLGLLDERSSASVPLTDEIAIFTAATESFNEKNTNTTIASSLERLAAVTEQARSRGLKVRGYISVAAGCPYEGAVDPKVVGDISQKLFQMGCYEVSLGDTVGVGTPSLMLELLNECIRYSPVETYAAHCHDTFGTGVANVLAMVNAGVRVVDSAVGGLGGCPYSPGATGNVDTESVVYALHKEGFETGLDLDKLAETGSWITEKLAKSNGSRAGRAVMSKHRQMQGENLEKRSTRKEEREKARAEKKELAKKARTETKEEQSRRDKAAHAARMAKQAGQEPQAKL